MPRKPIEAKPLTQMTLREIHRRLGALGRNWSRLPSEIQARHRAESEMLMDELYRRSGHIPRSSGEGTVRDHGQEAGE
jgi:hypothetical protein